MKPAMTPRIDHYATTVPSSLRVHLDGQPMEVPDGCTLAQLLSLLGQAQEAAATAVNGQHVPREQRGLHELREGDHILLFRPIVGG